MESALFQQHGAAGLVQQVAMATTHRLAHRAEQMLRAMIRIESPADRLAAFNAGGPLVICLCLDTFPNSLGIARAALIAGLTRSWGVSPSHGAPKRVIKAVCKAMATFKGDVLVIQGGLRLFKLHASSHMVETVAMVEATATAMRSFRHDETVQHFGATVISVVNSIEPRRLKDAHGEMGANSIMVTSVALAVSSPPSLRIGDRSWQEVVLATYPRLRVRQ